MIFVNNKVVIIFLFSFSSYKKANEFPINKTQNTQDTIPTIGIYRGIIGNLQVDKCKLVQYNYLTTNIKGLRVVSYTFERSGLGICFDFKEYKTDSIKFSVKQKILERESKKVSFYHIIVKDNYGNNYLLSKNISISLLGKGDCFSKNN
ncbi:MAG: hypothetical protein ABL940_03810 [Bacteroidia bacterium]